MVLLLRLRSTRTSNWRHGVTCSCPDCAVVLKYIGVGFGLTAAVGDCSKGLLKDKIGRKQRTNRIKEPARKMLAVDVLWPKEGSMARSSTSSPMEVWKQL